MKIRIMPMSLNDDEFVGQNIESVQKNFFKGYLPNEGKGWYQYAKSGLDAESGDLVLFQMANSIIASAILEDVLKYSKPTIDGNYGVLIFNTKSVKTFKPITKDELSNIINGFVSFNQVKQKYDESDVNMDMLNERMNYEK